jgi:protoporphyrinogen oxidase
MTRARVGIIGAGPAGLTAAYQLQALGADVAVFEASDQVGGLARSFDLWGHRVDLGPHRFFSSDERVNRIWREVLGAEYRLVARQTRIYYRQRFFDYPLRIANVLTNLGVVDITRALSSYLTERLLPERKADERDTFEAWVVHSFGRRLFEMFFRSYSEKLWGIGCDELDADFAAQRIKRFSLGESILAALHLGRTRHKTLVDEFAYPKAGSGDLYDRMARTIVTRGGEIHLSSPVARVQSSGTRVTGLQLRDGTTRAFDQVVSTMPLTLLVQSLGGADPVAADCAARLKFRNTLLVYLRVEATKLFPDQWLYIHSGDVCVGRITNFRNWVPELYGELDFTILALEFWCYDEDAMWSASDEVLVERARRESRAIGLLGSAPVTAGHVVRIRRCYPVYARGYRATLAPIVEYLKRLENLWPIGRYGSFKYNNQDHSILMGLLVAENICSGAKHDLWSVNTDYDSYQEAAVTDPLLAAGSGPQPRARRASARAPQ